MRPWVESAKHGDRHRVGVSERALLIVTVADGRRSGARGQPGELSLHPRSLSGYLSPPGLQLWF